MLDLSEVGFAFDRRLGPPDNAVECSSLLGIASAWSKARRNADFVFGCQRLLEPIQRIFWTSGREIVAMPRCGLGCYYDFVRNGALDRRRRWKNQSNGSWTLSSVRR